MAKVTLNNVRLSFPHIFEPQASQDGGQPKYNAILIIDPSDSKTVAKIEAAIEQAAKEKWQGKSEGILSQLRKTDKVAFRTEAKCNQNGEVYDGFEDRYWISSSTPSRPTVVDRDRSPLTAADGKPYGGCYVNAIIEIWPQDNKYGKRINAELKGIQFYRDGDAFAGGTPASADEFDVVDDDFEDDGSDLV